ncbi:ester cyclase [Geminicoccus harenae]|uniref:ester cyclase n=1 Tax=Geminicoccus harenae TaxID=2498453 RepID=UPI00168B300D|nr:ester cyclase [Geminicoccus harenae]
MRATLETWARRVWTERDAAAIDEMCAPDCKAYGLGPKPLVGPEQFRAFHQVLCGLLQETRLVVRQHIEQDGQLAALCTFSGRMADGREASADGVIYARVAGGKILEAHNHFDLLGFFTQLGLVPADTLECCMSGRPVGADG